MFIFIRILSKFKLTVRSTVNKPVYLSQT